MVATERRQSAKNSSPLVSFTTSVNIGKFGTSFLKAVRNIDGRGVALI
jgi:hypothetical protein